MNQTQSIILGLLAGIFIGLSGSIFTVPEGRQALVLQFGEVKQQISKPGLYFKVPLLQSIREFESRILNVDPPAEEVLLSDQKRVVVDSFARYRIENMVKYFQTLGTEEAAQARLHTIINATVRNALGKVGLQDILSENREKLMAQIEDTVNRDTARFGVKIVDTRIVRADLPQQTLESIFARMRTEREREAKEARAQGSEIAQSIRSEADKQRTILLAEAERDAQKIRGEGDNAAIKIYADAFSKDPQFYAFYRSMEAYRKALSDPETTLVLSPDSEFFRFFDHKSGQ